MTRKFSAVAGAAMLSAVLLSGCATTGGVGPSTDDAIKQVRDTIYGVCQFVPTVSTILSFFSAGGSVSQASDFAVKVCAAVTRTSFSRKKASTVVVVVNGKSVTIAGKFVR